MAVITITRQFGAGGSDVAHRVAARLGWTVVDRELVSAVAAEAGLPAEEVAAQEERVPSLIRRLGRALAVSSPEVFVPTEGTNAEVAEDRLVQVTEQVLREAASHGKVVVVGRGGAAILADAARWDALHVYVTAPKAVRVAAVAARQGLAPADAARLTETTDADRDRWVHRYYGRRREDPAHYHLVVNTGLLGLDGAADVVCGAAGRLGWK